MSSSRQYRYNASMTPSMTRRFQFSLKALLGLVMVAAMMLGAVHLAERYGQFVKTTTPCSPASTLNVEGRLITFFGPKVRHVELAAETMFPDSMRYSFADQMVPRSWFCMYNFTADVRALDTPGDYRLMLFDMDRPGARAMGALRVEYPDSDAPP